MYFNSGYRYTWLRLHLFVMLDALCITLAVRLPFTPRTEPKKNIFQFGVCVLTQKRIFRYGRCIVGLDFVINWPKKNQIVELMKWTIGNTLLVFFNRLFVYKKDYVFHKNFSSGMSAEPFLYFFTLRPIGLEHGWCWPLKLYGHIFFCFALFLWMYSFVCCFVSPLLLSKASHLKHFTTLLSKFISVLHAYFNLCIISRCAAYIWFCYGCDLINHNCLTFSTNQKVRTSYFINFSPLLI